MGGGLIQLAAQGGVDNYLTTDPQITFWKNVYKRYSPFAIETVRQDVQGAVEFGNIISCKFGRNGDLIKSVCIEIDIPEIPGSTSSDSVIYWVNSLGHALLKRTTLSIGEREVDSLTSEWLDIRDQLYLSEDRFMATSSMVGRYSSAQKSGHKRKLHVQLPFWFSDSPGAALPHVAIQDEDVNLSIHLRPLEELLYTMGITPSEAANQIRSTIQDLDINIWVDYVYLESSERMKIVNNPHTLIFTQHQYMTKTPVPAPVQTSRLDFVNPVKELIWVVRDSLRGRSANNQGYSNDIFNYSPSKHFKSIDFENRTILRDAFQSVSLLLNGVDRFVRHDASYFRLVDPMQHHSHIPRKLIYSYSFSISPEKEQPSGSLNFSRVDMSQFQFMMNDSIQQYDFLIYALNYNVMNIENGKAVIQFNN